MDGSWIYVFIADPGNLFYVLSFLSVQAEDKVTITTTKVTSKARKEAKPLTLPQTQSQSSWWQFTPSTFDAAAH